VKNLLVVAAALVIVVGAAWLLLGGQRPEADRPQAAAPKGGAADTMTRADEGAGGVSVSATYVTEDIFAQDQSLPRPKADPADAIVFFIAMNTHSVNLPDYPLDELTELSVNGTGFKPAGGWQPVSDNPHHLSGYLAFPRAAGGSGGIDEAGSMRLTIKGLAEVPERTLVWDLPLPGN
jgi:hypothetical protein